MENRITQEVASKSQPLLPYVPQEIITDILTRLPVVTLIRFRCVSKSWLNLILNPQFINTHLVKSSKSNNYSHQRLVIRYPWTYSETEQPSYMNSCSLHSMLLSGNDKNNINVVKLDYQWRELRDNVMILGSCNGLVCIGLGATFIWNPLTGESKPVPHCNDLSPFKCYSYYGFGYDQFNDDYKLVCTGFDSRVEHFNETEVRVYSLRTNWWGIIGNFPLGKPNYNSGKFVNGVLHWAVTKDLLSPTQIVALDLGNETYKEIAQPNYSKADTVHLAILDGCLTICCELIHIYVDIWVMKEYGVRDSWIKMYTIPYMVEPGTGRKYPYSPFCLSMMGDVFMSFLNGLLLYDSNLGTFRNAEVCGFSSSMEDFHVTNFVESLVSPKMYDQVGNPLH